MSKFEALVAFYSSFGIPAYEENSIYAVDAAPEFPYLTYELALDNYESGEIALSLSLWYNEYNWGALEDKTAEIAESIGEGGKFISLGNGEYIWIKRRSPFAQPADSPASSTIKRMIINISVEFLTRY